MPTWWSCYNSLLWPPSILWVLTQCHHTPRMLDYMAMQMRCQKVYRAQLGVEFLPVQFYFQLCKRVISWNLMQNTRWGHKVRLKNCADDVIELSISFMNFVGYNEKCLFEEMENQHYMRSLNDIGNGNEKYIFLFIHFLISVGVMTSGFLLHLYLGVFLTLSVSRADERWKFSNFFKIFKIWNFIATFGMTNTFEYKQF